MFYLAFAKQALCAIGGNPGTARLAVPFAKCEITWYWPVSF
jgi:hypothetical protein